MRDLPQRADLDALHELGENISPARRGQLQLAERGGRAAGIAGLKRPNRCHLVLFFLLGGANELGALVLLTGVRLREEGVDTDDRQAAVVFAGLVVERLFLDFAALIHGLHRAQDPAALGE